MPRIAHWDPTDKTIHRTFRTKSFARGVQFINRVATVADELDHHPDVILTALAVIMTLTSHDVGQVTEKDYALAQRINDIWEEIDAPASHAA